MHLYVSLSAARELEVEDLSRNGAGTGITIGGHSVVINASNLALNDTSVYMGNI